jgi:hypothetical protein
LVAGPVVALWLTGHLPFGVGAWAPAH